jgi:hypothetical protein
MPAGILEVIVVTNRKPAAGLGQRVLEIVFALS